LIYACVRRVIVLSPPDQDVVVLLPHPETNTVGRAVVIAPSGAPVELTTARQATRVVSGQSPGIPTTMSKGDVTQLFGDAMAARPPAPRHFLVYFLTGTDQLTPESETLLTTILDFVKGRDAPDVSVVGHTDTAGTSDSNVELSRSRATAIRDRLLAAGLDGNLVSVAYHGESNLLVRTPDDTPEPQNRRVEVSVR
jgi:adhesin transport system outer membrane protein